VTTAIKLELLSKTVSNVTLYILENNTLSYDLILGRDFLTDNNISFIYIPLSKELENKAIFSYFPAIFRNSNDKRC